MERRAGGLPGFPPAKEVFERSLGAPLDAIPPKHGQKHRVVHAVERLAQINRGQ